MPYDATPSLDDVILVAEGTPKGHRIALHLRVGADRPGELVGEWRGAGLHEMLARREFRATRNADLGADDPLLVGTVLDHAVKHRLGALAGFERSILDAMAVAEELAPGLYEALVADPPEEDFDAVMAAAGDALTGAPFPALSDRRVYDIHMHLQGVLEERYEKVGSPSP